MSTSPLPEPFDAILAADDPLTLIIRGHLRIEQWLNTLVSWHLHSDHKLEIERLSCALKVDMAVGMVPSLASVRDLLVVLNGLRNRFAHRPSAALVDADIANLRSALTKAADSPPLYDIIRDGVQQAVRSNPDAVTVEQAQAFQRHMSTAVRQSLANPPADATPMDVVRHALRGAVAILAATNDSIYELHLRVAATLAVGRAREARSPAIDSAALERAKNELQDEIEAMKLELRSRLPPSRGA